MGIEYREQLYQLIRDYLNKKTDTETFSNKFTIIYNLHIDYDNLYAKERESFSELSEMTSRFSPFDEDLKEYDCYYDAETVKKRP